MAACPQAPLPRLWSPGSRRFQNGARDSASVLGAALMICVILENWLNLSSISCFLISEDREVRSYLLSLGCYEDKEISSFPRENKASYALTLLIQGALD